MIPGCGCASGGHPFTAPTSLGIDGAHIASTLYHLANQHHEQANGHGADEHQARVYAQVANRLAELIDDVGRVWVDRDDQRELFTLMASDRGGTAHPARALSDGTLRFLALAVLDLEPTAQGLLCLEEPENGIHPARIPAMLRLLRDIATDTEYPIGADNPLRQVIINTHAPAVVRQVPEDSLLMAELKEQVQGARRFKAVRFSPLSGTWRDRVPGGVRSVSCGALLAYLNPEEAPEERAFPIAAPDRHRNGRGIVTRVIDRPDIQQLALAFDRDAE